MRIILGDRAYSSWSLRAWLLLERFGIAARTTFVDFSKGSVPEQVPDVAPARTVPTMITDAGTIVWDSLAIAEELASRHPEAGFWPQDAELRATARAITAEMHSGFLALRNDCPMALRVAYRGFAPSDAVRADVARIDEIWTHAMRLSDRRGPWLFGAYSVADAFFAPVAARIATYDLPVSERSWSYVMEHLNDPAFRRWRAMGLVRGATLPWYAKDLPTRDWPGPTSLAAEASVGGPSENTACPYSGDPVTDFLVLDDRVFGFCNPFCRDKTVADPAAWPAFMALVEASE